MVYQRLVELWFKCSTEFSIHF